MPPVAAGSQGPMVGMLGGASISQSCFKLAHSSVQSMMCEIVDSLFIVFG